MISSYCGIDCGICDFYINKRCPSCFKSEEKRGECQVPECTANMNVKTCLKCIKLDRCKKRRNAFVDCLFFLPRRDISPNRSYIIDGTDRDEAYNIFFRHTYGGADGLIVHFDAIDERWGYFLEDVKRIEGTCDIKEIQKKASLFIEDTYNPVVLIDNLLVLKERRPLPKLLEFLNEITKRAISKSGIVLIINDLEGGDKNIVIKFMANMLVESMLNAVSNQQRKAILKLLSKRGKSSFKDLIDELDYYNPSKISFHLNLLKDTGILEQDNDGIYSISLIGGEFENLIDSMTILSAQNVQLHSTPETKPGSDDRREGYRKYMRSEKKSRNFPLVNLVKNLNKSLGACYGKKQSEEIIITAMGDYIKSGASVDKKGLRRMVSEIVFVHLVSTMKLEKAMHWADMMIEEHDLND